MQSTAEPSWFGPSPPAELIGSKSCDSSYRLLSQGAEARVWLVNLSEAANNPETIPVKANLSVGSGINVPKINSLSQIQSISPGLTKTIVKERFPKKYRHPQLDASLTKSRTKAEARCLIRCQKAGVACPNVLAIAHWSNDGNSDKGNETGSTSSCLFLEHVDGCTVRHYFEERSTPSMESKVGESGEPEVKRARCETDQSETKQSQDRITTKIDNYTVAVAFNLGIAVAKMHASGIIHGDLTTSNVMLRNPNYESTENDNNGEVWTPQLVLIDFGLAGSIAPIQSAGKSNKNKQQHNVEEKAVDLYVLERAFLSTHPESELLVEEVLKGYCSYYERLDRNGDNGGDEKSEVGQFTHVSNSVMNRLEQVRQRGRKRECFG